MINTSNIVISCIIKIDSFFDKISKVCAVICGTLLAGVALIIFAGVFNRTFLQFTWLFVEEYSALALIPISYLAMGYTLRKNQHLKMDIVVRNIPLRAKQICGIFAAVFSFICIIYMASSAIDWFTYTYQRNVTSSGALRTPLWFISSTIVIGIVLFAADMFFLILHRLISMIWGQGIFKFIEDKEELVIEAQSGPEEGV